MLITKITPINKKQFEIHLDNELAFILYKGELRSFGMQEGEELADEDYNKIVNEILPKRALLRCGHLLEKRDYTEAELVQKLKMSKYPESAIAYAIGKVKGYGFINDLRYAERYIECYISKKSINYIKGKLFQKGIKKDIIEQALQNIKDSGTEQDEDELILSILKKRHYFETIEALNTRKEQEKQSGYDNRFSSDDLNEECELENRKQDNFDYYKEYNKEKAKHFSYLLSKGFSPTAISRNMKIDDAF